MQPHAPVDQWLHRLLSAGPVPVCEIETAAASLGACWKTVERAKARLSVKAVRQGRGWAWRLPQDGQQSAEPLANAPQPPAAPPRPAFTLGQFAMGYGAARLAEAGVSPRLVPFAMAMGRRRA
jgi:hypothetical protein